MIFEKKKNITEHKMCVLISFITFVWNISHYVKNWARYDQKIYIGLHVKFPLLLSIFSETLKFLTEFREIIKYQISWKTVLWEPDGRTDRHDEDNSCFWQFCERATKLEVPDLLWLNALIWLNTVLISMEVIPNYMHIYW